MERLLDRLDLDNRPPNKDQPDPQIRNPNFIRLPPPQIRKREKQNPMNVEDQ